MSPEKVSRGLKFELLRALVVLNGMGQTSFSVGLRKLRNQSRGV